MKTENAKGFFSKHDRFKDTSTVASGLERLDFRYRHVIKRNRALLKGKRVLDIASHDGRFMFAALKGGGASHVTGIEARQNMVDNAAGNIAHYGVAKDRYSLICGDVFEKIHEIEAGTIDTAMILGFLYHTARQYELFAAISKLGARNIIIDSRVLPNADRPVILLRMEDTQSDSQIWDETRRKALSSEPSALALQMIMEEFGYRVTHQPVTIKIPKSAQVYKKKSRVTMTGVKD